MNRDGITALLAAYGDTYPQESSTVQRYSEFVEAHEDCFERSQLKGHITGSAWLVNSSSTHVLLTHHKKLDKWLQLGGHADGNTDALAVAVKEAREESGIDAIAPLATTLFDIDIHEIPARKNEPAHFHYDARFALQVQGEDTYTVSHESHALEWVEISNLSQYTSEDSILRMAAKWQRFQPHQITKA